MRNLSLLLTLLACFACAPCKAHAGDGKARSATSPGQASSWQRKSQASRRHAMELRLLIQSCAKVPKAYWNPRKSRCEVIARKRPVWPWIVVGASGAVVVTSAIIASVLLSSALDRSPTRLSLGRGTLFGQN